MDNETEKYALSFSFESDVPLGNPADFNMDGVVDVADFLIFVDAFGSEQQKDARCDLNNDGIVSVADFLLFVESFGKTSKSGG